MTFQLSFHILSKQQFRPGRRELEKPGNSSAKKLMGSGEIFLAYF
jgi:hypothetical protein